MVVYVVIEISDAGRHIDGVFNCEEKAKMHISRMKWYKSVFKYEIKEYEVV